MDLVRLLLLTQKGRTRGQTYQQKIAATTDLIAYWPLSDTSGTAARNAQGISSRDAVYVNSPTLNQTGIGDGYGAPSFDGTNDHVNIHTASLASAFNGQSGTLALWFKVSALADWTDATIRYLARIRVNSANEIQVFKSSAANRIEINYIANSVSKQSRRDTSNETTWCHLAMTWDLVANQLKTYFNGTQFNSTLTTLGTWSGTIVNGNTTVGAGDTTAGGFPWKGQIAHVALWTTPLSAAQIADLLVIPP